MISMGRIREITCGCRSIIYYFRICFFCESSQAGLGAAPVNCKIRGLNVQESEIWPESVTPMEQLYACDDCFNISVGEKLSKKRLVQTLMAYARPYGLARPSSGYVDVYPCNVRKMRTWSALLLRF